MESISFEDFPTTFNSITQLYRTYVSQFDHIAKFYNGSYRDLSGNEALLEAIGKRNVNRYQIASILEEQQRRFGIGKESEEHAAALQHENTFAIVTGQQVGIFGGPLYTIYKIITAIKLAKSLNLTFPEYTFVPAFYLEAEDHDFEEMSVVTFLNMKNELQSLHYLPNGKPLEKNPGPVGSIVFDHTLHDLIGKIEENSLPSEFRTAVFDMLRSSYRQDVDFTTAFVDYIKTVFPHSGLIMIDPRDKKLKSLLKPVFTKEIETHPKTSEIVIHRSAILEEHYHAQAKPKAINLFLLVRGGRYLIEPREDGFSLKGSRQRFSSQEMFDLLEQSPELFSPNVILRPICQDYLLPTFVYVGGPSEIAYFAQLKDVYSYFNLVMPVIYPRVSATIIEEKVNRTLQKFDISAFDFFTDIDLLQKNITNKLSDVKLDDLFVKSLSAIDEHFKELRYGLQSVDPTLGDAFDNAKNKIEYQINKLKEKAFNAQRRNHANALHQIEKSLLHIAPSGIFQERMFPLLQYYNKYGLDFVKWLYERADVQKFEHQLFFR
jgi:bacillithiol synthase